MNEILYKSITIEGNIGAGKTTLASALAEKLNGRLLLESFEENPFLSLFYEDKDRYGFQVEMFFLAERYHQLSKNLLSDIFHTHTVSDYLFSKSAIFSGVNLKQAEHELFLNLYRIMEKYMPRPDILIYLHIPVDKVLEAIKKRGRSYEAQISSIYLNAIEAAYWQYMKEESRFPIIILDESDLENRDIQYTLKKAETILSREWPKGISHFSLF